MLLVLASVLIVLLIAVSIPLTLKIIREAGGPWGFGIVGLHILIPLNFYFIFAAAAFLKNSASKRSLFIIAHVVTVGLGLVTLFIFPVLPRLFLIIPVVLAVVGIADRKRLNLYLFLMIGLGIVANIVLLKWELDFGRTIPIIGLF